MNNFQPKKNVAVTLPWRPLFRITASGEESECVEIYRKFRGILNKLTPQKFQTLAEQVLMLDINTEEVLFVIVNMLHKKVNAGIKVDQDMF